MAILDLRAFDFPPALPVTYVYDRAGKLVTTRRGELTENELAPLLAGLLE